MLECLGLLLFSIYTHSRHPQGFQYYPNIYDSQIYIVRLIFICIPDSRHLLLTWHFHLAVQQAPYTSFAQNRISTSLLLQPQPSPSQEMALPFFQLVRHQTLELSLSLFSLSYSISNPQKIRSTLHQNTSKIQPLLTLPYSFRFKSRTPSSLTYTVTKTSWLVSLLHPCSLTVTVHTELESSF